MCQWLQRKPESLQAGNSDRLISFSFSASAFYCDLKLPGRCWSVSQSQKPLYPRGPQVVYLCLPLQKSLPFAPGSEDKHIRSLWYLDTVVWESLKYHRCFPRHCSESTALTTSESISAGSGPACINLSHPHPAKSLNSGWGRFLPGTTQPVPVKLHRGWIWLGTQGDRPPIHPSAGAAEILRSTL